MKFCNLSRAGLPRNILEPKAQLDHESLTFSFSNGVACWGSGDIFTPGKIVKFEVQEKVKLFFMFSFLFPLQVA